MILTENGATREIAEEILTDLEAVGREDSMLTAHMLISLAFGKKRAEDQEWLGRKWRAMSDRLKDTWLYQVITEGAREEAREEEHKLREEERRQELERLRQMLFSFVQARFANQKMELQARGQAALIDDPRILQRLILKVGLAQTAEEAQDYLLSWPEFEQEAS